MPDIDNLAAWAATKGYDENFDYVADADPDLKPGYVSEHFRASEFACNHCGQLHPSGKMPPKRLLAHLEDIRAHFGKPVNINSGYRCPVHNADVGGAESSRHLEGDAADLWIAGVSPAEVYEYANTIIGDEGGVGKYATFTHIDVRGYRARW